jgi:hypothetical protein
MMVLFEPNGFSVLDIENLRLHYARTLQHWLQRYEEHSAQVEELFDDTFVRLWRLYLAGSLAAFNTGTLQLFQVLFNRSGNNAVPWTRDYLYREPLLARISHQIDTISLDLCSHKEFSSLGNTHWYSARSENPL